MAAAPRERPTNQRRVTSLVPPPLFQAIEIQKPVLRLSK
jgi:hypothetical protein